MRNVKRIVLLAGLLWASFGVLGLSELAGISSGEIGGRVLMLPPMLFFGISGALGMHLNPKSVLTNVIDGWPCLTFGGVAVFYLVPAVWLVWKGQSKSRRGAEQK